ncbi:E3 ubiquitin-protein ligase ZFP91 isoform X1 [Polypterus senegalus]|uniref:E3 ubiquitin-protein ligase ZFP91 isoform X1 n=1 Tax=Polypterus senegalus TaxID=55291 RepID=UPI001965B31B|nr:E3 ubiquitin-protein ligase ZFP91 isoform X1 [Polypterus senegalus]
MESEPTRPNGDSGEPEPQSSEADAEQTRAAPVATAGDLSPTGSGRVLRGRTVTGATAAALATLVVRNSDEHPPSAPPSKPGPRSGRVLRVRTSRGGTAAAAREKSRGTAGCGQAADGADEGSAAARRRKAECPRRRRNPAVRGESVAQAPGDSGLTTTSKDRNDITKKESSPGTASCTPRSRPVRSRRGGRMNAAQQKDSTGNSKTAESQIDSDQFICKTEPDTEQKSYWAAPGDPPSKVGLSEEDEDMVISEEEPPFRDDPKDQNYKPQDERDPPKPRRRAQKGKNDKDKKLDIKTEVDVKQENEFGEEIEPPRKRGRRRKDDKSPRLPKRRKKPPIQYVRCEMEGCGTVLAHPRYLQHHIKYQHLLKKKYVCPHPSCGRLFRLQKQLLRHAKHHTDQRDYICEYCARAFKSSHNLAVHRMIHTGEKPLQCEICGFTCRQKASLNWHMKKHDADTFYQFSCNICGKKFEKKDSVVAHKAKSHPEVLIAEALAANAGALITSTDILGSNQESLAHPQEVVNAEHPGTESLLLTSPCMNQMTCDPDTLVIGAEELSIPHQARAVCATADRLVISPQVLASDTRILTTSTGLIINAEALGATTEVLIENSDHHILH